MDKQIIREGGEIVIPIHTPSAQLNPPQLLRMLLRAQLGTDYGVLLLGLKPLESSRSIVNE